MKDLLRISICCMGLFMTSREYINCLKDAIEIIYILSGLEENCIAREIHGSSFIIFYRRICNRCMTRRDDRGMRFGIEDKDMVRFGKKLYFYKLALQVIILEIW